MIDTTILLSPIIDGTTIFNKILKIIRYILIIFIINFTISQIAFAESKETHVHKEAGTSLYEDHLHIYDKSIKIYNNVWGMTDKERDDKILKSYIYHGSNGSFGWEWNRSDPRSDSGQYVTPIYPEAIIGAIPTDDDYTTHIFPIKYDDIVKWEGEVEFRYTKPPTGRHNLAYDIYFMDGNVKKLNVMIWIQGHHDEPSIGMVSDGINEYIHYYRAPVGEQYWYWHAFELKNQANVTSHKVNIKKLLDNTFGNDINGSLVVHGVELGSEIWRGSGRIEIYKYIIDVNGHTNIINKDIENAKVINKDIENAKVSILEVIVGILLVIIVILIVRRKNEKK